MTTPDSGPGFPRLALASAWFVTTLIVAVLGWIGSDSTLTAMAILALVATIAVTSNRFRDWTLRYSGAAGIVLIAVGIVAQAIIPVIAGIITARLSRRAWVMSR